jgi:hypothetical protein
VDCIVKQHAIKRQKTDVYHDLYYETLARIDTKLSQVCVSLIPQFLFIHFVLLRAL